MGISIITRGIKAMMNVMGSTQSIIFMGIKTNKVAATMGPKIRIKLVNK